MAQQKIELYSPKFYGLCATGGMMACGLTHTAIVTLDVLKCRKQIGLQTSVREILAKEGSRGLVLGWAPTLIGYSAQGLFKYGFYEYFKKTYADMAGEENSKKYKDLLYLSASASAEVLADIALCPWEAVKVRIQTDDPRYRRFPTTLRAGLPTIIRNEGTAGLFKGLVPLWSRQIPYTMMKFWAFERTVQALYTHIVPKPKSECSKVEQLGVSFVGGYIAGIFCAAVSHPADTVVSKMNQGATRPPVKQILKELGPRGLWNGFGLRVVMVGTLTGLQWLIYDTFKVYIGLPTTGAAPPPEKNSNSSLH